MALRVLDGNQTATTLSSVVTGGEHIVAHSVVSLGANAIANIASAVSGSVVSISNFPSTQTIAGTVTANVGNFPVKTAGQSGTDNGFLAYGYHYSDAEANAIPLTFNGDNNLSLEIGGNVKIGNPVTIGNSVTIGSLPAISGTVTANGGNFSATDGAVTSPSQVVAIGYRDSAGNGLFKMANSDDQLFPVRIADSIPISGTVTANVPFASTTATFPNQIVAIGYRDGLDGNTIKEVNNDNGELPVKIQKIDAGGAPNSQFASWIVDSGGDVPISGTVTIGNSVTIGSLPTLTPQLPRATFIDGSGSVTTANSAITVFASSTTRSYLLVQVTTGSAFVNVGATATTVNGINLTAGQGYAWETTIPQGLVSLISTTTSSRWVAKEA
jgi:acetyltransferase-like isoleucine patch superfamily enzyme